MKNKALILITIILFSVGLSAQQSSWKTNKDGWIMRKSPNSKKYEKFFAIGLWNVPGYTTEAMENAPISYRENAKKYLNNTSLYNIVYMSPGKEKDIHDRVEITGSIAFYEFLKEYGNNILDITKGADSDYAKRQYIKNNVNNPEFVKALDSTIQHTIDLNGSVDHIWAPIDEIVNGGGGGGWCWHPDLGEKIKERIKKKEKNTLIYTDLMGMGRGNTYLFEKNYLKTNKSMPTTPPYEMLGNEAKIMEARPLLGFFQAFDGKPVYINGTASYTEYDLETLKILFYENIKLCAKDYKGCGDVFGINAFIDFNTHPVLAGVTVDAIKAGIGNDTPVWLFFDGNGYAKPSGMSATNFVNLLKCQIYTSIIHGATGVLFWNDRSKSPDVFNALEPIIEELANNKDLFYLNSVTKKFSGNLHYMIKKDGDKKYIIASNTSKTEPVELNISGIEKRNLAPLEVFIFAY